MLSVYCAVNMDPLTRPLILSVMLMLAAEMHASVVPRSCRDYTCYNGGSCRMAGTYTPECSCLPGYIGGHCRTESFRGCRPNPCRYGGTCTEISTTYGNRYNCSCRAGYTGVVCQIAAATRPPPTVDPISGDYNCGNNNPCNPLLHAGQYYYTAEEPSHFVQCSEWGQCWVMPCGPGTNWNQALYTCT